MQSLIDQVYVAQIREKELRLSEKSAQLDVLQMQISPHFLYNTLDMSAGNACTRAARGAAPPA